MAVTDCGGQGSLCATDLTGLAAHLATATAHVSDALDDCKGGFSLRCLGDTAGIAKAVAGVASSISKAAKDCNNGTAVVAAPPLTVTNAIEDSAFLYVRILRRASPRCAPT
jgi:hypothetical protein